MTKPPHATANPHRGEAELEIAGYKHVLRPSFSALVAAEEELGPLYALIERASAGHLKLGELEALFWHCLDHRGCVSRSEVGQAIAVLGLAQCSRPLRVLLGQILRGVS